MQQWEFEIKVLTEELEVTDAKIRNDILEFAFNKLEKLYGFDVRGEYQECDFEK